MVSSEISLEANSPGQFPHADSVGQALLNVSRVTSIYVGPFSRNSGLGLLTNPSFAQSFDAFLLSG